MDDADRALLTRLGLEGPLKQAEINAALGAALHHVLQLTGVDFATVAKQTVVFMFTAASGLPAARAARRDLVCQYIANGKLVTAPQVNAAVEYFKKQQPTGDADIPEFEAACGAGVVITDEELRAKVGREVAYGTRAQQLHSDKYRNHHSRDFLVAIQRLLSLRHALSASTDG